MEFRTETRNITQCSEHFRSVILRQDLTGSSRILTRTPLGLCAAGAKESHSHDDRRDRHGRMSRSGRGERKRPLFNDCVWQFQPSCCTRSVSPCLWTLGKSELLEFVKLTALQPSSMASIQGLLPSVASSLYLMPLFLRLKQFVQNPGCFCRKRTTLKSLETWTSTRIGWCCICFFLTDKSHAQSVTWFPCCRPQFFCSHTSSDRFPSNAETPAFAGLYCTICTASLLTSSHYRLTGVMASDELEAQDLRRLLWLDVIGTSQSMVFLPIWNMGRKDMIASLHHLLYSVVWVYTELHQSIRRFSIPTKVSECHLHHWSKLDVLSLLLYWPEHRSGFVESQQGTFGFANRGTLETMSMFKRFVEPGRLALITYGPCTVLPAVWGQRDNLRQAISINFV